MTEGVKVVIRVRPMNSSEQAQGSATSVATDSTSVSIGPKTFHFDHVFNTGASQKDVFDKSSLSLLDGFFLGYNATIFAYGQTGSGKTYTMGTDFNETTPGIIPQVMQHVFVQAAELYDTKMITTELKLSYLEILNEDVLDLLGPPSAEGLKIVEDPKKGVIVHGLTEHTVKSLEDVKQLLVRGAKQRATASTSMNDTSSRSHAICTLTMQQHPASDSEPSKISKFHLVDLAGSERAKKTHAEGERFREGVHINKALLVLGKVITCLSEKKKGKASFVPYREAKLTRLLQDSLGGNSKTVMVACISPADVNFEETTSTLRYAEQARCIQNTAMINCNPAADEVAYLRQQVELLKLQLQQQPATSSSQNDLEVRAELVRVKNQLEQTRQAKDQWKALAQNHVNDPQAISEAVATEMRDIASIDGIIAEREVIMNALRSEDSTESIKVRLQSLQAQYTSQVEACSTMSSPQQEVKLAIATNTQQEVKRLQKLHDNGLLKITTLEKELLSLKQIKTQLQKKLAQEAKDHQKEKREQNLKLIQLQRQDMKKNAQLKKLESIHAKQTNMLKRKTEEIAKIQASKKLKTSTLKPKVQSNISIEETKKLVQDVIDMNMTIHGAKSALQIEFDQRKAIASELSELPPSADCDEVMQAKRKELEDKLSSKNRSIRDLQRKLQVVINQNQGAEKLCVSQLAQCHQVIQTLFTIAVSATKKCQDLQDVEAQLRAVDEKLIAQSDQATATINTLRNEITALQATKKKKVASSMPKNVFVMDEDVIFSSSSEQDDEDSDYTESYHVNCCTCHGTCKTKTCACRASKRQCGLSCRCSSGKCRNRPSEIEDIMHEIFSDPIIDAHQDKENIMDDNPNQRRVALLCLYGKVVKLNWTAECRSEQPEMSYDNQALILHPSNAVSSYVTQPQRYRGLSNQGATCYMNSLLQTLFMTPEFRNRLYLSKTNGSGDLDTNIPFQLQKLFANLQLNKERKAIDTKALTKSFGWNSSDVFQQHDVQELCRVLFDALEESFKGTPDEQIVNDLYQGTLKDYVQCVQCGHESSRLDNFLDLSLVIRPFGSNQMMKSVEEAIEFFLKPEKLSGDNQWDCDKCKSKQDAIKGLKFSKLPYLLSLQLKRFDFDYTTFNRIKLNNQVTFPKYLNMNAYDSTHGSVARKMSIERMEMSEESLNVPTPRRISMDSTDEQDTWSDEFDVKTLFAQGPYIYELFSVLIHSGSAMGGHYFAYIKSFEDNQWYNFNDSNVSKITENEVQTAWGQASTPTNGNYYYRANHSTSAYMLMYRQLNPDRNSTFLTDEELPSFLQELIQADEVRRLAKEKEREERARMMQLKVFYENDHKTLQISKLTPLSEATKQAIALFDLKIDPLNARLRSYSEYANLPQDTYHGREDKTLAELNIYAHCCLYLEVKSDQDEWVPYDPTALQLVVRKYVPSTAEKPEHFTEPPLHIQVPEESRVEDLVQLLSAKFAIAPKNLRVLQMSSSSYWSIQTNILNPSDEPMYMHRSLRMDCQLRHGSEIYVEECENLATWSLAKELFEVKAHMITIQVKTKERELLASAPTDVQETGMTWPFQVDRRDNLQVLKDKLVKFFNRPANTFKLCRGVEKGQELKDLGTSFKNLTLMHNTTVFVVLGTPLAVGEFSVQIQLYSPKVMAVDTDAVMLPPWMQPDELSFCTSLVVSNDMTIAEMKAKIMPIVQEKHPTAKYLRLRDLLSSRRLSRILLDSQTLAKASPFSLYENREFAVQIIDKPDELDPNHMLFSVILFDRRTYRFGQRVEISFTTNAPNENWIDNLLEQVQLHFNIPPSAAQLAKPLQSSDVDVLEVQDMTWLGIEDGHRAPAATTLANYGDRLIVCDTREELKELSTEERKQLQATIERLTENDMMLGPTMYGPALPGPSGYYKSSYTYSKPKETALFIRTSKPSSAKSSNDSTPVSPSTGQETSEDVEFSRAGGADLFTDLH